jgi:hypothetical protein
VNPSAEPFDGARFVAGTVELAAAEAVAIRVTVTQEGSEQKTKNGHSHKWQEIHRRTVARPFYLLHSTGERIRVEPTEDVLFVDTLDQREWIEPLRRSLRAELLPGEHAVVEGVLRKAPDPEAEGVSVGYREAASRGWVMKPGRSGMHVSVEDLSRRHALRAKAFRSTLVWVILLGIAAQVPLWTHRQRYFLGANMVAEYTEKTSYVTRNSKGQITTHYVVKLFYDDEKSFRHYETLEIDSDDYEDLPAKGRIWVRHVPGHPEATALGAGSSVGAVPWFLAAGLLGIGGYRVIAAHRYRRWYEGPVVHKGNGRLPPYTGERFLADQKTAKS